MGSPTELVTEPLYALNAYGSAMAPLFMNLTFWIGAFMLLVIMKQEVDGEGIRNLTVTQRYLGRFALLAALAVLQAVVCCAGVLLIGVQAANAPALFFAAAVASLAYLSIIYALSVTLQHIGKGLCIVLVFAQIPGATGLYPIEMTAGFFQAVYPYLPFTYGIAAMREAICGLYGTQYLDALGTLAVFFAVFMALGILVRPLMANVNRMVAGQVRQSGLFNGEDVEIPARPYRFSQLFRALTGKDEYREELLRALRALRALVPAPHPRLGGSGACRARGAGRPLRAHAHREGVAAHGLARVAGGRLRVPGGGGEPARQFRAPAAAGRHVRRRTAGAGRRAQRDGARRRRPPGRRRGRWPCVTSRASSGATSRACSPTS